MEKQHDTTGCGISCIASVQQKRYKKVKRDSIKNKIFDKKTKNFRMYNSEIKKWLKINKRFTSLKKLEPSRKH